MKTIRCNKHPGGATDLPETDFYPSDRKNPSGMCKKCNAAYYKAHDAAKRAARKAEKEQAAPAQPTPSPVVEPSAVSAELTTTCAMRRIGGYFIHEQALLVADALQPGKVTLFTTILEIDGETKHPRNKRIIFSQQASPDEYRATLQWLAELSSTPAPAADAERDAALQLAEEYETKLRAAENKNAELEKALSGVRSLLNGHLITK
jgi:hypothetical protein